MMPVEATAEQKEMARMFCSSHHDVRPKSLPKEEWKLVFCRDCYGIAQFAADEYGSGRQEENDRLRKYLSHRIDQMKPGSAYQELEQFLTIVMGGKVDAE